MASSSRFHASSNRRWTTRRLIWANRKSAVFRTSSGAPLRSSSTSFQFRWSAGDRRLRRIRRRTAWRRASGGGGSSLPILGQRLVGLAGSEQRGSQAELGRQPGRGLVGGAAEGGELLVRVRQPLVAEAQEPVGQPGQLRGRRQFLPPVFQQRGGRAELARVEIQTGLEIIGGRAGAVGGQVPKQLPASSRSPASTSRFAMFHTS